MNVRREFPLPALVAIALVLATATAAFSQQPIPITPELRQHVDAGLKARAAGDWDAAIRAFQRVVALAPDLAAAHVNLGTAFYQKQAFADAVGPLRRALELQPDLPGARQMLGASLLAAGAPSQAVPYLDKSASPDLLGIALLESGHPREALDQLEAALLAKPEDPDLQYYLSQAHGQLSKQLFDRLRGSPAGATRTQQMLGEAAAASGQRDQAEKHWLAVLAARPALRGINLSLGDLHLAAANYTKAEAAFRAEVKLAPLSAVAAYQLGLALTNLGRTTEATTQFVRSNQLQPDMPETLLALGKNYIALGMLQQAEAPFQKVLALEPDSNLAEAAHLQLSQLYRRLNRPTDATKHQNAFQTLRQRRPPTP